MPKPYIPNFIVNPDAAFVALWNELDWERRGSTPRFEYFSSDIGLPYSYGKGAGVREYLPKPWHPVMLEIKNAVENYCEDKMDVCFINGYQDGKDHLGWHADDSPEMDDARPICIVSLGAEREIWFRKTSEPFPYEGMKAGEMTVIAASGVDRVKLRHGSLLIMPPGMQDTHQHRIPKAGFECGPRISLTFRGYVAPEM